MPPKRKRGGAAGKGRGGKKAKTADESDQPEPEAPVPAKATRGRGRGRSGKNAAANSVPAEPEPEAPTITKQIIENLKKTDNKKRTAKVDQYCRLSRLAATVLEEYDCMLNQTNIGQNNNKYYVIQVIKSGGNYYSWNRWGRVGEPGANSLKGPMSQDKAIKDFEKKFYDKTRNNWSERETFIAVHGKYTLLEMGDEEEEELPVTKVDDKLKVTLPCTLDKPTQDLIKLIFDNDMFNEAMKNLEIDVKKMPLGKISKSQIAKGFEVLEKIADALKTNRTYLLQQLSSDFYTLIPHNFGRQRPPSINDSEFLQKKMDLLTVLGDIEVAQAIQKEEKKGDCKSGEEKVPHPLDNKYGLLQCDLTHLEENSKVFKILEKYLTATGYSNLKILDIWQVNRHSEGPRFSVNDKIENRKLLWHGTNVAVVVAILKSGLRIMPHSGGRVGRGIYFASENSKSAGYVGTTADRTGIMFLNEVALGKEHHITRDDSSLVVAPKGFDSIVARGCTEPDPKFDTEIVLDNHKVIVPQGKVINQPQFSNSSFSQSEYLIYREDQCRIRFILKLKF